MDRPRPTWHGQPLGQPLGESQLHASLDAKGDGAAAGYVARFDVRDKAYPWLTFAMPLTLLIVGIIGIRRGQFGRGRWGRVRGGVYVLFMAAVLAISVVSYERTRARLVRHLNPARLP